MPGLVAFGRRWSIGSDDLFLPSISLFIFHIAWISATVGAIIVDFDELTNWEKNGCTVHVLEIMCCILVLLLFASVVELCLTVISLRGSILNDTPRSGIPYLMYIRLFSLILELIWSAFAITWSQKFYFSCNLVLTKQVMIGLTLWTWFVLLSVIITAWCVYDVAGRSWVKMKRYQANFREMEHRHPSFKRSGSTQRNWRQRKVLRAYENSWNNRCKFLFCCIHNSESSRDSFGDLAKLLSEFFRDLDVVPSDIIVGLLLLRKLQRLKQCSIIDEKKNNTYEFLSGIAITPNTKFVAMNDAQDLEAYHNVVYYMRYASAAYGWLWYVIPNGFSGLFNLCSNVRCCFHRYVCSSLGNELSDVVVEDNCCFCNVAVIPTMFDPSSFDIVYATYHVDVGETPFFVVVDYEKKAVVVSIRGTLSLKDVMTDLNAEAEPLPLNPVREDWLGHKGMVQAAFYLKSKLVGEKILDQAFEKCRSKNLDPFNIVIVGHSLGGGTAAILAILLREEHPTLKCYAYSPPGGLLSMPAVEYTKEFVTSVIVGKDVVPRIGLSQMEALRADLINAIKKSHTPKWQTIMSRVACCRCMARTEFSSSDLATPPSKQNECSSTSQRSFQEGLLSPNESVVSMTMHQPLYPPGRIMHVVRHHPKKDERIIGKKEPVFQAIWTENTDYGEVLISPGMIQDHMPDNVLRALNRLLCDFDYFDTSIDIRMVSEIPQQESIPMHVTTSYGPAKPHRTLTNASPMNCVTETASGIAVECSSKMQSEAPSFVSEASVTSVCANGITVNPWTVEQQTVICSPTNDVPEDIDNEECDDCISLAATNSTETLFSLKISWDYFKELGTFPSTRKALTAYTHSRQNSSGSSNCSELGTTMKELFGPIRLYECTVPLASSETLSEISSMSSRASFNIMKDRSPLSRLKLSKNLSLRIHENGNGTDLLVNGSNKSHQRSFSCVYPEGKKASNYNLFATLNGGSNCSSKLENSLTGSKEDFNIPIVTTTSVENGSSHYTVDEEECLSNASVKEDSKDEPAEPQEDVSKADSVENSREEVSESRSALNPGISDSDGINYSYSQSEHYLCDEYSPVYPVFSVLTEYGAPVPHSSHYNYSSQSPLGSTPSVHSDTGNNDEGAFYL